MKLLSRWIESLDYEYNISNRCTRYISPKSQCTKCIDACPAEAIFLEDGKPSVQTDSCIECGYCVAICPVQAIEGFLPKRTIKQKKLIIDGKKPPTVKELLAYYKEGITTIVYQTKNIDPIWNEVIGRTNIALHKLGEEPFQVTNNFEEIVEKRKISRRELFTIWKKDLQKVGRHITPAKWRFNHRSLNLAKYYPNHQFVDFSIDIEKCTLCQTCQKVCEQGCFEITNMTFKINPQKCTTCSLCQDICPEKAITLKEMISSLQSIEYPVYENECTSCHQPFTTLRPKQTLCFLCEKNEGKDSTDRLQQLMFKQ